MPCTIFANSHNWETFSGVVKATNGLSPALGNTDSRAAAISLSRAEVDVVVVLLLWSKKWNIFLYNTVIPSKSFAPLVSHVNTSSINLLDSCVIWLACVCRSYSCCTNAVS